MDDDIMPNDGTYFAQPREQAIGRVKEKAKVLQGMDLLQDMIIRLEERIEFYGKTTSIPDAVRTNPTEFMAVSNSYSLTAKNLITEKEYLQGLIDEYAPHR